MTPRSLKGHRKTFYSCFVVPEGKTGIPVRILEIPKPSILLHSIISCYWTFCYWIFRLPDYDF